MPELPEVETVRRGLVSHLVGRRIEAITICHPRAVRRHAPGVTLDLAVGRQVTAVRRRGKYLWWELDDGKSIIAHLGMSGQFRFHPRSHAPSHPHLRVIFELDDGQVCWFLDQRTFGGTQYSPSSAHPPTEIAHIARDLLDPQCELAGVVRQLRSKDRPIKALLLDQTITSGIGNIYADEALWRARIHPERPGRGVSARKLNELLGAVQQIFAAAIAVGGTSFDALYVNVSGESGYFARSLEAYGRAGEPCSRCGSAIRRITITNRSSHFCPTCQRKR